MVSCTQRSINVTSTTMSLRETLARSIRWPPQQRILQRPYDVFLFFAVASTTTEVD